MSDEDKPKSFEEALRAIADEVHARHRSASRRGDLEDIARTYGVDADRAKRFFDSAGRLAARPDREPSRHAVPAGRARRRPESTRVPPTTPLDDVR